MVAFLLTLLCTVALAFYTVERLGLAGWVTLVVSTIVALLVMCLTPPRNPRGGAHP